MILVDSGVVIDYERTLDPKLDHLFRVLPVAVCGVTRAEVLHGTRSPHDRVKLLSILALFSTMLIPDDLWDHVGDNLAALRAGGVTIPFPDAVLATVAIASGCDLWTRDHHFAHIQRILPALSLFVEPP